MEMTNLQRRDFLGATGATAISLTTNAMVQRAARAADNQLAVHEAILRACGVPLN